MNVKAILAREYATRGFVTIRAGDGEVVGPFLKLIPRNSFEVSAIAFNAEMDATTIARIIERTHTSELVAPIAKLTVSAGECDAVRAP